MTGDKQGFWGRTRDALLERGAFKIDDPTSFQEKMAWVMLGGVALSGIFYFGVLWTVAREGGLLELNRGGVGGLLVEMTIILVVVAVIGAIFSALVNLSDADEPEDERDGLIKGRAARVADPTTGLILFGVLTLYFLGYNTSVMACGIIAAMWVGTFADYLVRVVLYRTA